MNTQVHLPSLANAKNVLNNSYNSGFTLPETLLVVLLIGILATLGIPNWMAFVATRRLNTAQNEVYHAMRQAQRQATKDKFTWQASFREQNGIVQWAVHPATVNPSNANWNNLDSNVQLDAETTLQISNGVRQIKFDYRGNIVSLPRSITISSKYGGKTKRCVYISTILGAMRMAKERPTPNNEGDYCY
ncbi:prepilin-type N-terminal cleavage/methylation domain-containing protein [Desmonostoc muscorum LEGE 12446]|uniref:Prepilin-type N-terminal cleavage/methylation domain-containing protein n=1 Tax=Desmonostoc muscorum LEGE 12446 TaxID=1828758 RepID=A0A8J6ZWW5_DESMC|nr:prepilin-type N-terminal cleavage/methylation domain-containing protein [Desmonostoc muscorum]MCF2147375.1 prepilin-type N-terminal cleavage/methylation domain-containing protein [Desmonostoc muscorum LEGE 12446]